MKNSGKHLRAWLTCWLGMIALFGLSSCGPSSVSMPATETKAADVSPTVDRTATVAAHIIQAVLAVTSTPNAKAALSQPSLDIAATKTVDASRLSTGVAATLSWQLSAGE